MKGYKSATVLFGGFMLAACALTINAEELPGISCVTEPVKSVKLSLPVSGRIAEITAEEGDQVKAGALLVRLEDEVESLEMQRRRLVWKSTAELDGARDQLAIYKSLLDSTKELFKVTQSVSRDELNKLELQYSSAHADVNKLQDAEKREKIEFELAKANLEKRRLYAPFAGTIVKVEREVGESADANEPVMELVDTREAYLECNVEERAGRTISAQQQVPVRITTGDSFWQGTGTVVFVSPVVDPASSLMKVKVKFTNVDGIVRPGVPGYISIGQ